MHTDSLLTELSGKTHDYTVEVTNRLKGLDLIDRVLKNYGQRFVTLYKRQGSRPSPRKRNAKKGKMAVWGGLTNSCEKEKQKAKEKRKVISI